MALTVEGQLPLGSEDGHSFRAEWAKKLVEESITKFWLSRPSEDPAWEDVKGPIPSKDDIKKGILPKIPDTGLEDKDTSPYQICIIGAGVAGLFTAMTIDRLNEKFNLGFKYEILEAADQKRFGGRLYTHRFSDQLHDYYDVGAMRFPEISIMKRTFDLFEKSLEFVKDTTGPQPINEGTNVSLSTPVKLIKYYLDGNLCPQYYNDLHYRQPPVDVDDPFRVQSHREDEKIPDEFLKLGSKGPSKALAQVIAPFKNALKKDAENGITDGDGWKKLMSVDHLSVRQFLANQGYNYRTIEWMETFGRFVEFVHEIYLINLHLSGTLNFDEALSESVIGSLDFDYHSGDPNKPVEWWCIEGGAQQVADAMRTKLKEGDVQFNKRVTMIKRDFRIKGHNDMEIRVGPAKENEADEDRRRYAAVFNSTTLASMQRMDLTDAVLNYGTKLAIRALRYGVSCKVGIKFKRPWWIQDYKIDQGGVGQTDLPLRVCVYPSYNIKDSVKKDAVLLCSYTWGQDAQRFSALVSKKTKENATLDKPSDDDKELMEMLFHNLALLHCPQKDGLKDEKAYLKLYDEIKSEYLEHHAYDWGADPFMSGAFAHFGPGQFSKMYSDIITPSAGGKLFIIGEAASKHHAWIVGALESAVRGVYQFLMRYQGAKKLEVEDAIKWLQSKENSPYGPVPYEEEDREKVRHQVYIADVRERAKRDGVRIEGPNV
ncbi:hypothetical protein MMC17_001713 [Xylographa soralifera]|nr:hypothetical protein [Xylographa soralifera]